MRRGDFAAAWQVSDAILQRRLAANEDCSHWPRHLQFIWRGQPLASRRVLVRCYHGLGDTIQFARLLAPLRARAAEVTLWAQPALHELLRSVRGIDRLLPLHDGVPDAEYDVDIELMELAHALRLTLAEVPAQVPYIYVSVPAAQRAVGGLRHVGIAWRSGDWAPERSIDEQYLVRLGSAPGIRWYSLQYPPRQPPLAAVNLASRDIAVMAACMAMLDLVISVDTMTAHLAGALGLPVWTLLHDDCDWRWMSERDASPWYPTMRLFRQRRHGDWGGVLDDVLAALCDFKLQPPNLHSPAAREKTKAVS